MQTLPLYPDRSYSYQITLNDVSWSLSFLWNPRNQQWSLSIAYSDTGEALISGVPLLVGIDILSQFVRPSTEFGKLLIWNDDWDSFIESKTRPNNGFQEMGFSAIQDVVSYPESGTWQPNLNPVSDYILYYLLPDEEIPEKFNFNPPEEDRNIIVSKIVYGQWTP